MTVPKVKLYTGDDKFVAEVTIPPFKVMPEVLVWGTRVFKLHGVNSYREVFCYCVPILSPADPNLFNVCGIDCQPGDSRCNGYCNGTEPAPAKQS